MASGQFLGSSVSHYGIQSPGVYNTDPMYPTILHLEHINPTPIRVQSAQAR
jgi:hypothetical protein